VNFFTKLSILRPLHWIKNILCFAGLIFGGRLFNIESLSSAILLFIIFSITSSAIYIFNDIKDKKFDEHHYKKKNRLIASGLISIRLAYLIFSLLLISSLMSSYLLSINVFYIIVLYLINGIIYTLYLKNIPIIDVTIIALGFVFRLLSGIYLYNDSPTVWIILCTFFLAMFLGFGKRYAEYKSKPLDKNKNLKRRPVLRYYSLQYLNTLINDTSIITIISYSIFTVASGRNTNLIITIPIVFYSISYYKSLIMYSNSEEPEKILISNLNIIFPIILWLLISVSILYSDFSLF